MSDTFNDPENFELAVASFRRREERRNNRTKPLRKRNYISGAGQLSLTKLVDDAVEALEGIHHSGVGRQRSRSRGVILRSFREVLQSAGYSESQAYEQWRNQVLPIFELNINADN
jgi:hypothetical protein